MWTSIILLPLHFLLLWPLHQSCSRTWHAPYKRIRNNTPSPPVDIEVCITPQSLPALHIHALQKASNPPSPPSLCRKAQTKVDQIGTVGQSMGELTHQPALSRSRWYSYSQLRTIHTPPPHVQVPLMRELLMATPPHTHKDPTLASTKTLHLQAKNPPPTRQPKHSLVT
jgi:hypothetical protein